MALSSDGLLDHLFFIVAISGNKGTITCSPLGCNTASNRCPMIRAKVRYAYNIILLTRLSGVDVHEFVQTVQTFKARQPQEEITEGQDEEDILFSAKPPSAAPGTDAHFLQIAWLWLENQPDVTVQHVQQTPAQPTVPLQDAAPLTATTSDSEPEFVAFRNTHANDRLHATEDRTWHALTGHGVDWKRLPKLEFQCLSVIAAHGPAGILQPDVTAITGQDKRSVPKRTDQLHEKGYISKQACLGGGLKTSLLRLKKFDSEASAATQFQIKRSTDTIGSGQTMIRYDQWFDDIVSALKRNDMILATDDLRQELVRGKCRPDSGKVH